MREVSRSLMALCLLAGACGSDDAVRGDAIGREMSQDPATAKDAGKGNGGKDAGKDASKPVTSTGDAGAKDPANCGRSTFSTGSVIPDMLIVLDRSGSMKPGLDLSAGLRCDGDLDFATALSCTIAGIDCNNAQDKMTVNCGGTMTRGAVDRWTPSVNAIKTLTAQFDQSVNFGLVTFPASRNECGPGDFKVPVGPGTSGEIASVLNNTQPGGGTPTGETLTAVLDSFKQNPGPADSVPPARYVLLVTDGQPTCPNSNGGSANTRNLQADKQYTIDALDALSDYGVKTFVVGYDAQLDPTLAMSLTDFAQHGGTDNYYPVQNEDSLIDAFKSISEKVVTCTFEFKEEVKNPDYLRVTLDGVTLKRPDPNGWTIDGQTITILGTSCDLLQQEEKNHHLEMVLECEPVLYL